MLYRPNSMVVNCAMVDELLLRMRVSNPYISACTALKAFQGAVLELYHSPVPSLK